MKKSFVLLVSIILITLSFGKTTSSSKPIPKKKSVKILNQKKYSSITKNKKTYAQKIGQKMTRSLKSYSYVFSLGTTVGFFNASYEPLNIFYNVPLENFLSTNASLTANFQILKTISPNNQMGIGVMLDRANGDWLGHKINLGANIPVYFIFRHVFFIKHDATKPFFFLEMGTSFGKSNNMLNVENNNGMGYINTYKTSLEYGGLYYAVGGGFLFANHFQTTIGYYTSNGTESFKGETTPKVKSIPPVEGKSNIFYRRWMLSIGYNF